MPYRRGGSNPLSRTNLNMRAINHSLTGALIGLSVVNPLIAIPVAFFSHYLLDVIPHFSKEKIDSLEFDIFLIIDALLCFILVIFLIINRPLSWQLAIACAFIAASPDFLSINHYLKEKRNKPWKAGLYSRFASKIQWFEKPIGIVVEIVWLLAFTFCISFFINR